MFKTNVAKMNVTTVSTIQTFMVCLSLSLQFPANLSYFLSSFSKKSLGHNNAIPGKTSHFSKWIPPETRMTPRIAPKI